MWCAFVEGLVGSQSVVSLLIHPSILPDLLTQPPAGKFDSLHRRLSQTSACLRLEPSRRLGRSPSVAKQLVTGLFDEFVSAHVAVSLPQLVPAFWATLPAERSGHALDNFGEHRCVLANNTRMIPDGLA